MSNKHRIQHMLLCASLPLFLVSAKAGIEPTYRAEPDPTAATEAIPMLLHPKQQITFKASSVTDYDTKTSYTVTNGNCASSDTFVLDGYSASKWIISDPGSTGDIEKSGLTATLEVSPWLWYEGDGKYGSSITTFGAFLFDDGRGDTDPRHDAKTIGEVSVLKIIPDHVTTALSTKPLCKGNFHYGHCFKHTVYNESYPSFNFAGMELKEKILRVICDNPDETKINEIKNGANSTWNIIGQNEFDLNDGHGGGGNISELLRKSPYVTLWQIYQITSWDWLSKNPYHAIGSTKTITFGQIQEITFVITKDNDLIRSTKNGITCDCTPQVCGGI